MVLNRDTSRRSEGWPHQAFNISLLDKCNQDMNYADFHMWRHSVEDWLRLNEVKDKQAVCYIRLLCIPTFEKALDQAPPCKVGCFVACSSTRHDR